MKNKLLAIFSVVLVLFSVFAFAEDSAAGSNDTASSGSEQNVAAETTAQTQEQTQAQPTLRQKGGDKLENRQQRFNESQTALQQRAARLAEENRTKGAQALNERMQQRQERFNENQQKMQERMQQREKERQDQQGMELTSRYNHLLCRITLVSDAVDAFSKYDSTLSLTKEKLTADAATLKGYTDAKDKENFNKFVTTTLNNDVKAAEDAVKEARKTANVSKEEKDSMKSTWKTSVSEFATCNQNSARDVASNRKTQMNSQVDDWNKQVAEMESNGLDTAQVKEIVSDAQKVESDFDSVINSQNKTDFKSAVEELRNNHLHLWARFNVARLNSYIGKVEPSANAAGLQSKIDEIKALLSQASDMAAPGKKYGDGEFKATWEKIKQANDKLKELVKEIKSQSKATANTTDTTQTPAGEAA